MSDNALLEMGIRDILAGTDTVIYTPIDPRTNKIPSRVLDSYPSKKIKDNIHIRYSPNIHKMYLETGKIPLLFVNYKTVLDYKYYGTERPPERPLEKQFEDWRNGYMWGRTPIPNTSHPEKDIKALEVLYGAKIPRGWYWVKYHARLVTLPAVIGKIERGLVKVSYAIPSTLATTPLIKDLYQYITKENQKIMQNLIDLLGTVGYKIDNELEYEVGGKKYKGVQIFISKDNKNYEVYAPIVRTTAAQAIQLAPLAIVASVIIAISFSITGYFISKAVIISAKEPTKRQEAVLNFLAEHPEYKDDPELAKAILNTTESLNEDPSGTSLFEEYAQFIKWGAIGTLGLVGGILGLSLLRYLPEPRRW